MVGGMARNSLRQRRIRMWFRGHIAARHGSKLTGTGTNTGITIIKAIRRLYGKLYTYGGSFAEEGADRVHRRYYATVDEGVQWPPEIVDYNSRFTKLLQTIKHRHDPVVTTMGILQLPPS